MTEKKSMPMSSSNQMVAIILDLLGIILVVVGALYTHYHAGSGGGEAVFWVGFILLIIALILFIWQNMKKMSM